MPLVAISTTAWRVWLRLASIMASWAGSAVSISSATCRSAAKLSFPADR